MSRSAVLGYERQTLLGIGGLQYNRVLFDLQKQDT